MKQRVSLERVFSKERPDIAKLLLQFFGGNPYYAMSKEVAGETTYQPIKQPLNEDIMNSHLRGDVVLGAYHLEKDNMVRWLGWDVDSNDREASKRMAEKIIHRLKDIPHAVEFSGSKGYHILIFLESPMPAEKAKAIVDFVRDSEGLAKTGTSHVECYPKQSALTKSLPMGNLLKIPLGIHPKTHDKSRFVDPFNGWENGPDQDPEHLLMNLVTHDKLFDLLQEETDARKQIIELLTPHWVALEGEHHNFSLYLAGYFAHLGWGLQDATDIIKTVALAAGDQEIHNRVQAVEDTYRNIEQGRNVKGFSGLNDILPGATVRTLIELATKIITPSLVKRIDQIRLQKSASFEKTRAAASVIWSDLQENGEVVQTNYHVAHWYDTVSHMLTPLESMRWEALLHHNYGLNPRDSFGLQVTEEVRLKAISEARTITVQNRTVWTGDKLYVNLGGPVVYELTGNDIQTTYNGECGFLFQTNSYATFEIAPDFRNPIDVWKMLVDDLSFNKSESAPASPEEQAELLKAWILAFFFQELMPTKPLLLALGMPGSGKTTAMRRILKVIESFDSEVLEVVQDKPDSLRASLAVHRLIVLDNLEKTGAKWLVDVLNRLATGANIELRKLYQTNEIYVIKPNCFVGMTAVSMPFSEETLFSRILPLEMQQLAAPLPEYMLQKQLQENMNGMWADLLIKLNQVVATLKRNNTQVPPIASRLADFTVFCKRIENSGVVKGAVLIKGLRSLVDRQKTALLEASPFITVLEDWISTQPDEVVKFHTFGELFSILQPLAHMRKLTWRWSNAAGLARHVLTMAEPLKKLYGAEFTEEYDTALRKEVHKVRFSHG